MEDVKFLRTHSNSPLPEAGNDPGDPLRPEIDEENSTPRPPLADPNMDMEVTEADLERAAEDQEDTGIPAAADAKEDLDLSDNESELSELDEGQFGDFDPENIAIEERPADVIDETNLNLIGVHKRKRTDGEDGEKRKKKKLTRREKPKRGRRGEDDEGEAEGGDRKTRKRKEGKVRGASPDSDDESHLTPEERRKRAVNRAMDEALKRTSTRRKKVDGIDLEALADSQIEDLRRRMSLAAEADNEGRKKGEPAYHKLMLLPEVVAMLNRNTLKDAIVDPEINLLESVRFFLEPLSDGSLPAYEIQKEMLAALAKLPLTKDSLIASGIGKVILFYTKTKVAEPHIKRQAERLYQDWVRLVLRKTDDYSQKQFREAEYDQTKRPARAPVDAAAAARAKALELPRNWSRPRMETGPTAYKVVPKSQMKMTETSSRKQKNEFDEVLKKIKQKNRKPRISPTKLYHEKNSGAPILWGI